MRCLPDGEIREIVEDFLSLRELRMNLALTS